MGCKSTKPDTFNIETEYRNKNLTMPDKSLFENEFEKEAYMTINVLRTDPKLLIPLIRDVKGNVSREHSTIFKLIITYMLYIGSKLYKGKRWNSLIKELEKMEDNNALPILQLDELACKACKENNDK